MKLKGFVQLGLLILICVGLYVGLNRRVSLSKDTVVAIQPMEFTDLEIMDSIAFHLSENYGFKIIVLPNQPMPTDAFVQIKSPRYRADILLKYLQSIIPDTADYILGLTSKDISTTKKDENGQIKKPESKYKDWGVFGLGYRPGNASIVSSYRLHSTRKNIIERLVKVSNHEIGHNLGLKHCTAAVNCVMDDANETIRTVDQASSTLCAQCRSRLSR